MPCGESSKERIIIGTREVPIEEGLELGVEGPCFELKKQNQAIIAHVYFSDDKIKRAAVPLC